MTDDIDEAVDWQGRAVNCTGCAHQALNRAGGCRLKHACVNDRYARRIDRFFNWNPGLADSYVGHPHFEVRAIAAKFANIFRLPGLLDDPDEAVRWNAIRRLPKRYALQLRKDPHREVRMRIATLLDGDELLPMTSDEDYYVRLVVARRLAPVLLGRMIDDEEAAFHQYSYGKYFGYVPLSDNDQAKINAGEETVLDRTRRLFYVCCSRAVKDLAVVIFVPDVAAASAAIADTVR